MSNLPLRMPKGTFDSQLAKVIFGDDVTRQRGPLSDAQQREHAAKLLEWLSDQPAVVILMGAALIDSRVVSRLHGRHLRVVVKWFVENAPTATQSMPVLSRYTLAMARAVGYNSLFQPAPLARLRGALAYEAGHAGLGDS
ncbi:hypothetical protein [uncultured Variovorax sp.]|uniref:hypothetical protein n=1 Tax=uncultured Variovorax sp. TaxID=114708 RepID=UPI0026211CF9|nr:hypothetical protein [uncultured Variovorax sp.]